MSRVVLFGTGRGADVAHRFLARDTDHDVVGFTLDRKYITSETFHDLPVWPFEDVDKRFPPGEFDMFICLGYQRMNGLRADKYLEAKAKGYACISYVNSHFYRAEELDIGENCFILDNQSISLDVKIGNNVVMWSSNHVGDESVIDDHVWLASHVTVAAQVVVGSRSFLGLSCTVSTRVHLGEQTFVGANALVTESTEPGTIHLTNGTSVGDLDSTAFLRVMTGAGKL